jgi:hypothetical protein
LNLIPVVNSRRVELPDDRRMIEELRRLERRRGRSGKDTIDHPAYGGSDDLANAVAGVIHMTLAGARIDLSQIVLVGERSFDRSRSWEDQRSPNERGTINELWDSGALFRRGRGDW